jgi:branched-chain amino acid transport system substrate-binding protein
MGEVMAKRGHKRAVTITWKYAAGDEMVGGFKEAFEKGGGQVLKDLNLPFPNVEFQALLTEIASLRPDAVFAFFAGGGAVKFVKDYAAPGLNKTASRCTAPASSPTARWRPRASGAGPADHAALRRRLDTPRDNAFRLPTPRPTSCSPTSTRCRATTRRRCWPSAWPRSRATSSKRAEFAPRCAGRRSTARAASSRCRARTTRCRTSTCARSKGKQNKVDRHREQGAGRPGARLQAM